MLGVGGRVTYVDMASSDAIRYQTQVAEHGLATFKDGSKLELNGKTTLFVEEDPHHRRVFLEAGEFRASIRHNPEQPLEVFVDHTLIEDEGTQFDVELHDHIIMTSVTEGQVAIKNRRDNGSYTNPVTLTASTTKHRPVILNAGDAVRLQEQGDLVVVTNREVNDLQAAQNRTAWLNREFVSFGQRLDETVWQFEHYTNKQVLIEDAVAQRVIGGTYDLMNVDEFLKSLGPYGIEARPLEGFPREAEVYSLRIAAHGTPKDRRSLHKSPRP